MFNMLHTAMDQSMVCYLPSSYIVWTIENFLESIMSPSNLDSSDKGWIPIPLRNWFWIPLVLFLVAGAGGLETALYFSKKKQGGFPFLLRHSCFF